MSVSDKKYPGEGITKTPLTAQNICLHCAYHKDYGGCCRVYPETKEDQLPLTHEDIRRISAYTGLTPEDFVDERSVTEEQQAVFQKISPVLHMQVCTGKKYCLKTKEDMSCVFLEEGKGCSLGAEKPRVCLSYPWFPTSNTAMEPVLGGACMAWHYTSGDEEETLKLLGMSQSELDELRRQIIAETIAHVVEEGAREAFTSLQKEEENLAE